MMPVAITCDLRTRIVRFQFTNPDCLLTAEQALACSLVDSNELKELEQEAKAFGMGANQ